LSVGKVKVNIRLVYSKQPSLVDLYSEMAIMIKSVIIWKHCKSFEPLLTNHLFKWERYFFFPFFLLFVESLINKNTLHNA